MLTAKCPHCDATLHCGESQVNVECSNCGEILFREVFTDACALAEPEVMNIELENVKSLRSIAMTLQTVAAFYVKSYYDNCDSIGPLEGD